MPDLSFCLSLFVNLRVRALVDNHFRSRIASELCERRRVIGRVERVKPACPMKRVGESVIEYVLGRLGAHSLDFSASPIWQLGFVFFAPIEHGVDLLLRG